MLFLFRKRRRVEKPLGQSSPTKFVDNDQQRKECRESHADGDARTSVHWVFGRMLENSRASSERWILRKNILGNYRFIRFVTTSRSAVRNIYTKTADDSRRTNDKRTWKYTELAGKALKATSLFAVFYFINVMSK